METPASENATTPATADATVDNRAIQEAPRDETSVSQQAQAEINTQGGSAQASAGSSYFKPPPGVVVGPAADIDEATDNKRESGRDGISDGSDTKIHGDAVSGGSHGDAALGNNHDDAVPVDENVHSDDPNEEQKHDGQGNSFLQRNPSTEAVSGSFHWLKAQELMTLPVNIATSILDRTKYAGETAETASPPRWTFPPAYTNGCDTFVAAVPSTMESIQAGACHLNGHGGTDVLVRFDDFSVTDLADLDEILGAGTRDKILRTALWRPSHDEVEKQLSSLGTRREFAAILAQISPKKLAERTFAMISSLRQMLAKYRRMRVLVEEKSTETQAVQAALDAQEECDRIKGEWRYMCEYWSHREETRANDLAEVRVEHGQDIHRLAHNHFLEIELLKNKLHALKQQFQDLKYENAKLKTGDHLPGRRFTAWDFMDFMMDHANVFPNWERLLVLCQHYENGTVPDPSMKTRCMVDALDDLNAPVKPYPSKTEREPPNQGSLPGSHNTDAPGPGSASVIDMTQQSTSSPPKTVAPGTTKNSVPGRRYQSRGAQLSKKQPPKEIQARPSRRKASRGCNVLLPDDPRRVSKTEARKALGPIIWKELRPDVREAMRSRLTYQGALDWLSEDRPAHNLFIESALVDMLISMMFWNQLDGTPWTRYVPDCYFQVAESHLEILRGDGVIPPEWGPLDQGGIVYPFGPESESSEDDDPGKDSDYNPEQDSDDGKDEEGETEKLVPETTISVQENLDQDDEDSDEDLLPKNKRRLSGGSTRASPAKKTRTRSDQSATQAVVPLREKSILARIEYEDLTLAQLRIQEIPEAGISSWRHYGALMQYASSSAQAKEQTPGFPRYEVHKPEMTPLYNRWSCEAYRALEETKPWEEMFESRVKELHFHKRSELPKKVKAGLDRYVGFMRNHQRAFWEAQHWVPIDKDADDDSGSIQEERRVRRESLKNSYKVLLKRLRKIPGFPETLFEEPGLWTLPSKCCYWIWHDGQVVVATKGKEDHSLPAQLEEIDWAEPARTQWATRSDDTQFLKHVSAELREQHLSSKIRVKNPITLSV